MTTGEEVLEQMPLIQRHRSFIASGAKPAALASAQTESDDLPVLTEVVDPASVQPELREQVVDQPPSIPPDRLEALAREMLFERLPTQRQALADELAGWLDHELPQIVMRVLDGVTDQLVAQITEDSRSALLPRLQAALEDEPNPSADESSTPTA